MYLKMYIKSERFYQQPENQALKEEKCFSDFDEDFDDREGGGGPARRCARDAASPAQTHAPAPAPTASSVKVERLSPHESTASRSRSVTPSTSSYPGTPPERGSPSHAPPAPAHPPRNYSDIMRSLAARYNTHPTNDYFHRVNGFGVEPRAPVQSNDTNDAPMGGLFAKLAKQQGGPPRIPAFPVMIDMTSTKTLLAISRVGRGGRSRRKRIGTGTVPEHSPLDLSAAGETAAKRARLSASPSTRSDDDRDRISNEDRSETRDCLCAEARARISAWSVDDVCDFVNSIDICNEYVSNFREQRIDGAGLPLLTEDHLTGMLQMKLGPALKLRAVLARRLESCAQCQANTLLTAPVTPNTPKINGTLKPEPRSNTTSPS
ncbi:polyhomeotic-like protein 3 isoform X2 [Pieris napi]|uniref:polyhomeotic-like protein 3 isoform X2 n=1 Tax=Pieris napi TaxID=78633 RepID=UPI001FBA7601|nr:polyhomeotic-like protein 3 isoform X2 [Pieris napi]